MFRAFSCPSSGATTTAVAASGLPSELGDSSAVGRGRSGRPAGPTSVTHLLITKFILKLARICGFCNVNICT
jgi:hypothetical protein